MKREKAIHLIRTYIESWIHQDLDRCLKVLCDDVIVTECDGTSYAGIHQAHRWFTDWHKAPTNGQVTDWIIGHLAVDEAHDTAAAEWTFECVCYGEASSFRGVSVFAFQEDRISLIHEYQMKEIDPSSGT